MTHDCKSGASRKKTPLDRHKASSPIGNPSRRQLSYRPISELKADPRNPRMHTPGQVQAIANSIEAFGFNAPILVDGYGVVVVGHGRLAAAKLLGLKEVPVICLDGLSQEQLRAYMIADNRLTDCSMWDEKELGIHLKELSELALEFNIEATGFELPQIDLLIQGTEDADETDCDDIFSVSEDSPVSRAGDLWCLGGNRLFCGDAEKAESYLSVMGGEVAAAAFIDFPYNVKIAGHVSGLGSKKHGEFIQASGEMSSAEFTSFLAAALAHIAEHTSANAIAFACMDWRHMVELQTAALADGYELLNVCVWVKTNGGMGSFYRSKHEFIFVFAKRKAKHTNNIQLGRFGRNRTNVWNYAGANIRPRKGGENLLALHPTVKPIMLVADAVRDSTKRGEIVLDPFVGSGTSILAAERVGRRCYGIELDARYVDTAIARFERMTGKSAVHANGKTFLQIASERRAGNE